MTIEDREITRFSTQKTVTLLAYLAFYRNQSHPREVLLEMLWPECEPNAGRARLRTALWSLRRQLERPGETASLFQADAFSVGLNAALASTDVAAFLAALRQASRASSVADRIAHLQQAVSLYSGELLPGYYEDWVLREQHRLADLYEQAVQGLATLQREASELLVLPEGASTLGEPNPFPASLPPTFTRFFGREEEMVRLEALLSPSASGSARLITLTGTGGTGKTRLSLEAARRLLPAFSGSVWFAPLADLRDPSLIGSSLVDALSLPRSGKIDPLEQVIAFLNEKSAPSLLVLDNFELLVEGGAEVVQTLLERVPAVSLLVTSRRLLHLAAEREFALRPLPVPDAEEPLDRLSLYESVQLFIDRAQTARPDFQVTHKNAPAIAQLCHDLEGIPLALELAAARALMLTPAQMLSQMERRFSFLVSKRRDITARHKTLQAAIEWSFRLLAPELQQFFSRLSVFRSGWTLEAAEAVCEEPNALEYLEQLREWSLIQATETEQGMRYTVLETLREYAEEPLSTEERDATERRHADFFLTYVETTLPSEVMFRHGSLQIVNGNQPEALRRGLAAFKRWGDRLEPDQDNLRAALHRALANARFEWILRMSLACHPFWRLHGRFAEARQWLGAGLESRGERTAQRAEALYWAGFFTKNLREYSAAQSFHQQALDIRRELDDPIGVVTSLIELGNINQNQGDYISARPYYEEALPIGRKTGEAGLVAEIFLCYGVALGGLGDRDTGRQMLVEGLLLAREAGVPRPQIWGRRVMAGWYKEDGDFASALPLLHDALRIAVELGDRREMTADIGNLAVFAADQGDTERATRLMGAATALQESMDLPRRSFDEQIGTVREALSEAAFTAAWEVGRAMTWEQAIAYALEES